MVIITLTTVPDRIKSGLEKNLNTLLNQTYTNYEVHLNIPLYYQEKLVQIPKWLKELEETSVLKIFRCYDYGPVTKILPTLERGGDKNDILITVDDDLYYYDTMVEEHIKARELYPDYALGFAGLGSIDGTKHFVTTVEKNIRVKVLEGYKTVSYLRKFFDVDEFSENFALKHWRDDHTISAYMGYKNIEKWVLAYSGDTTFEPKVESFPVIDNVPMPFSGCRVFRDKNLDESIIDEFYKEGYLER